ncbi:MAG: hypothetical protein P8Y18_05905 [Candidatus Bathyarchaeota archaeon]
MQKNLKPRSSFARKIITVVFLPIIILIWMIGWTLTQIGNSDRSMETDAKILEINSKFGTLESNSENDNEKISNYPISA